MGSHIDAGAIFVSMYGVGSKHLLGPSDIYRPVSSRSNMPAEEIGYQDVSEFLFDLEDRYDVLSWTVESEPVWDYIRLPLHRKILRGTRNQSATISYDSYQDFLKGGYLWARNLLVKNPMLGDCQILGFGTGRRKQLEDGYWWDVYFDPLYEGTEMDYLHVELPFANSHKMPAKTDNLRYIELIQYSGAICYQLGLLFVDFTRSDRSLLSDLEAEIRSEFDLEVDIRELIEERLIKSRAKQPLFDVFLQRVDPEAVLLTCSYGQEAFVKACNANSIPVIELQHGTIDPFHPGYSYPESRTKLFFPDYLFVWGEFWKNGIEYPIPKDSVVPVGYPHQEKQSRAYDGTEAEEQILFISQPTEAKEMSEFAVQLASDDRFSSKVIYKIHPKRYDDWRDHYPALETADIRVIDSDSPPLYELLAKSRAIVGVSSTVIYESFHFGPEVYLLNVPTVGVMEWISHLDHVHMVDSVDDLIGKNSREGSSVDSSHFFADNSIQRIADQINRIVKKV